MKQKLLTLHIGAEYPVVHDRFLQRLDAGKINEGMRDAGSLPALMQKSGACIPLLGDEG